MSTTEKLAGALQVKGNTQVAQAKPQGLMGIVSSESFKKQLAVALPRALNAEKFTRIVMTEMRKNPKLCSCDQMSFLGAVMQLAQLGLEPTGIGHAYLVPYGKTCTPIIGYKGMLDLARRSGQIVSIKATVVCENDDFHYELGLHEDIHHIPAAANRGKLTYVYAVAKLKDGGLQFEVMSRADIESIRSRSKAGTSGPWVTDFDEMAKKTVIRRLFKYLPISIEAQQAVVVDEKTDRGEGTDYADALDGVYVEKGVDLDSGEVITDAPVADDKNEALPD